MANQRTWTDNQLNAITAHGGSVIVSAAAGSGKTTVLVERVIRMITDPDPDKRVDVDRLLIVTYTRAAAAELKERLFKALSDCIREHPADTGLLKQQALLSKANISTVDSFCSSLAREYFYILDIDRRYRIGDPGELAVLRADAMRLTLDAMYAEGDRNFFVLVETFASSKSDAALEENVNRLYDFIMSHPFPNRWLDEKLACFDNFTDASSSVWGRIISDYTRDAAEYMNNLWDRAWDAISKDEVLYKKASVLFQADRDFLDRLSDAVLREHWDGIRDALASFVPGRFPTVKGYTDHPLKREAAAARDAFKDVVSKLKKLYAQEESMCVYDIELLKDYAEQLFKAVRLFRENYSALKRERNLADYADLEHWAVELLVDENTMARTPLAEEISSRFSEIMVDEFQDANETQDVIFSALSEGKDNLFVVGDVKQSIYGFRHAMPELFQRRKNNAVLYHENHPVFPAKVILEQNFRSEKHLLAAVNYFFSKLMSPSVGDIDYNDEERLYHGLPYDEPVSAPIELDLIDKEGVDEKNTAVAEGRFIAERIRQMIASGYPVKDGENYRPVTCGDIAILIRNMTKAPKYIETLNLCGIRTNSKSGDSFLDSLEIMLISNLLRVISNPAVDIPLLSTLMSPVFGFDANDLARMRAAHPRGSLYAALTLDARENRKSAEFLEELRYYRGISVTLPLSKLINTIYERSSFMAVISAFDNASAARNNLRVFLDYARTFEQNTHKGLSAFINYLDRLVENKSDLPAAAGEDNTGSDTVTVMSMHSSKGLEFPIVILAELCHGFVSDTTEKVLLHPKYGYVQKRYDKALSVSYNTMPYEALSLEIKRSELSEELRILYVALTRARQKLICVASPTRGVTGYLNGISKKLCGERDLTPYIVRSASSMADWLTMCAVIHPDGVPLRERIDAEVDYESAADFAFDMNVIDTPFDAEASDDGSAPSDAPDPDEPDPLIIDELKRHASFVYPYDGLRGLPVKVAASTLAHKQSVRSGERYLARPAFLSNEKLTGAEKGTALHAFMQFADFAAARADIRAELSRLTDGGFLTAMQAESIDLERAGRFIHSGLVTRCLNAEQVYKEYRFTVRIPAGRVSDSIDESLYDETVILQGAVDLAFVEDGALVIVDYKTDRVRHPEQLREMYAAQLMLYKDALEECLRLPVKECTIYSVRHSVEVVVYEAK